MKTLSYSVSDQRVLHTGDRFRVAKQILAILSDALGKKSLKNLRVLDVGCSNGAITYYLASYVKSIIGIDVDVIALTIAQKTFRRNNLQFYKASGLHLPFQGEHFDVVICNEVYSYIPDDKKLMAEIFRVLKPGGCCYFSGGNLLYPVESRYHIPFLHNLPDAIARWLYRILKGKPYYVAHYKTYWQLQTLLKRFTISDYTLKILKNPKKFSFTKLYALSAITNYLPEIVMKTLEPFCPTFIFVLSKNS